jgi:hypothetical protein
LASITLNPSAIVSTVHGGGKRLIEKITNSSLVFADCGARQRLLAGLANIGEMIFHAGLDPASARLGACAILFHVRGVRLAVAALSGTT